MLLARINELVFNTHPFRYKPMVYIVEPNDLDGRHLASLFVRLGYSIRRYGRAEDLLDELAIGAITGCVVSEIDLPGINGLELLDELRARQADIPFIILTSDPEVSSAVAAFRQKVSGYLMKPAVERDLAKAVETAMGRSDSDENSVH